MAKYYDIGDGIKFRLERTSSGYFQLTTVEGGMYLNHMFSTEVEALREIISYAEIDKEDFE